MSQSTELIIGLLIGGIFLLCLILIYFYLKLNKIKKLNIKLHSNLNNLKNYDLIEAEKAKSFLDKIIKDKFEYYFITEILPVYKIGKTLDKKQVNDLKDQFFLDVSFFINKEAKKILKKYYNTEAIKIYIIEKFFINLNKIDVTYFEDAKISDKEIKSLIK